MNSPCERGDEIGYSGRQETLFALRLRDTFKMEIRLDSFAYRKGRLHCEAVEVDALAESIGTPFYLYSAATLRRHYATFASTFAAVRPRICYSIKNCSNIHIIALLAGCGAGIDVVSGGELHRALQAGAPPHTIVFAGVGKTSEEIREAIAAGIGWLNIESEQEFANARCIAAELGREVSVALRLNPNIYDPLTPSECATGKKDSKFGLDISNARSFLAANGRDRFLNLKGLHIHLGSPIYSGEPYAAAIRVVLELIEDARAAGWADIDMIDIGGGYIASYDGQRDEDLGWQPYAQSIVPLLEGFVSRGGTVIMEPGRSISANAGVLVSKIQYTKRGVEKNFAILDSGMSHIIRPAFYGAYHFIWPTVVAPAFEPTTRTSDQKMPGLTTYDVVGPICESSDYLARDRALPPVKRGDLLCIFTAGAYGMAMASQYNSRPRPAEVLVDGGTATVIRERETYHDLIALERNPTPIRL